MPGRICWPPMVAQAARVLAQSGNSFTIPTKTDLGCCEYLLPSLLDTRRMVGPLVKSRHKVPFLKDLFRGENSFIGK